MIECPNCGSYHVMSLEQPDDKTPFYECHECGEVSRDEQADEDYEPLDAFREIGTWDSEE